MSQALYTASTGINAGQQQINVIANNVANINTVAYKSANLTFETLFSRNLSYGSAATKEGGGTNPQQIGLGVKIGGISRNFGAGTFVNTGRDTDVMISGNGYFVVQGTDGKQYYTRDGIFTTDSEGNLVTQSGLKVYGAKSPYSGIPSSETVKVPTNLKTTINSTSKDEIRHKKLSELNGVDISSGDFNVTIYDKDGKEIVIKDADDKDVKNPLKLTVDASKTLQENVDAFNAILNPKGLDKPPLKADITEDGHFIFIPAVDDSVNPPVANTVNFDPIDTNFLAETNISNVALESKDLNMSVVIQDLLDFNDENGIAVSSVTIIDENGIISASYSDGSILTTQINDQNVAEWRFTTPEGYIITGEDVTAKGSINKNSNFIIELASFINEEGLVSLNNNLWEWGPDAGEVFYGMAGEMAFGSLESGGYEGSNVDIAKELSNMISAQRMIQMNSRVFGTASQVMETLAYLGQ